MEAYTTVSCIKITFTANVFIRKISIIKHLFSFILRQTYVILTCIKNGI